MKYSSRYGIVIWIQQNYYNLNGFNIGDCWYSYLSYRSYLLMRIQLTLDFLSEENVSVSSSSPWRPPEGRGSRRGGMLESCSLILRSNRTIESKRSQCRAHVRERQSPWQAAYRRHPAEQVASERLSVSIQHYLSLYLPLRLSNHPAPPSTPATLPAIFSYVSLRLLECLYRSRVYTDRLCNSR